jgi:hypothetical protein
MIYEFALPARFYMVKERVLEPALLAANKEIREEASPIFYANCTFLTSNISRDIGYFERLGPDRFAMLRSVQHVTSGNIDWGLHQLHRCRRWVSREQEWILKCLRRDALLVRHRDSSGSLRWLPLAELKGTELIEEDSGWYVRWKNTDGCHIQFCRNELFSSLRSRGIQWRSR